MTGPTKTYDVDIKGTYRVQASNIEDAMARAYEIADGTEAPTEQNRVVDTECIGVVLL